MKSRLAILTTLVLGMLLSTTGAGLAVTGLAASDASVAQYGPKQPPPTTQVLPPAAPPAASPGPSAQPPAQPPAPSAGPTAPPAGDVQPEQDESAPSPERPAPRGDVAPESANPLQAVRQLQAGDAQRLPFTGLAAIPILLAGVALLGTGVALRRQTRAE